MSRSVSRSAVVAAPELEPVDGGTRVTETFDWEHARSPLALELLGIPARNARSIDATLERLAARFA